MRVLCIGGLALASLLAQLGTEEAHVSYVPTVSPAVQRLPEVPDILNFGQVDAQLYRSAQPTARGFLEARRFGIRTVIDLQDGDRSGEKAIVESLGMLYVNVPMNGWPLLGFGRPTDYQLNRAIVQVLARPGPILIHCTHGRDRTGTVVAIYRTQHGWTPREAYAEARFFGISPFQPGMRRYIRHLPYLPYLKAK